jgi:hypothetical protein
MLHRTKRAASATANTDAGGASSAARSQETNIARLRLCNGNRFQLLVTLTQRRQGSDQTVERRGASRRARPEARVPASRITRLKSVVAQRCSG